MCGGGVSAGLNTAVSPMHAPVSAAAGDGCGPGKRLSRASALIDSGHKYDIHNIFSESEFSLIITVFPTYR